MGSKGDSYDNALAEALNSLYKAEQPPVPDKPVSTKPEALMPPIKQINRLCLLQAQTRRATLPASTSVIKAQFTACFGLPTCCT